MINAVERLWQALAAGDVHRATMELHQHVTVERPHAGQSLEGVDAFLAPYAGAPITVRRVVTEGRHVASDIQAGRWSVGGFYTLHDGRILHAAEYWVATGS